MRIRGMRDEISFMKEPSRLKASPQGAFRAQVFSQQTS